MPRPTSAERAVGAGVRPHPGPKANRRQPLGAVQVPALAGM